MYTRYLSNQYKGKKTNLFSYIFVIKKRTKNPKHVPHVFFSLLIPLVSIKIKLCVYKETIFDDTKYQQRLQNCIHFTSFEIISNPGARARKYKLTGN